MFLEMLLGIGLGVIIILTILTIIGFLTVAFTCGSILYSRIAFSLLAGLLLCQKNHLVESGFLNFLIWTAIAAAVIFGLSTLPRSNGAISFFCTVLITTLVVAGVGSLIFSVINFLAKTGAETSLTKGYEILIKVVAGGFGIFAYIKQRNQGSLFAPEGVIPVFFDRIVSSLAIGFSIVFLYAPLNGNWKTSETLEWIILIVASLAAFLADLYLVQGCVSDET